MTLDNMTGITEGSYTGFCKRQLITCNRVKECNGVCPFEDALKHADKEDAPTIDAVEVVRCKDCKDSRVYGKTTQWLACESVMEGQATDPDGYCYLGERSENE